MFYDHPLHLGLLAGPDYSTAIVSVTNPELVDLAAKTPAPNADVHGYRTVKDIMDGFNPLEVDLPRGAGVHPHRPHHVPDVRQVPASVHAGAGRRVDHRQHHHLQRVLRQPGQDLRLCQAHRRDLGRHLRLLPRHQPVVLRRWPAASQPDPDRDLGRPGRLRRHLANIDTWGHARYSAPGIIKDGELVTTKITEINMGIEEFVEHSYYDDWTTGNNGAEPRFPHDELGNPLSPYHAWNKETIPRPEGKNFKEKYSWSTAPRWDRIAMETGVYGRMWTTAMAQQLPDNPYLEATGDGLRILLPAHDLPEMELNWKVPAKLNAFERNRGRAYGIAFTAAIGMICLNQAFDLWAQGRYQGVDAVHRARDERVSSACGRPAGLPDPSHAHGQGQARQLPDQHPVHLERRPPGSVRQPRAYEEAIVGTRSSRAWPTTTSRASDILRPSAASTPACRAPPTWTPAGASSPAK